MKKSDRDYMNEMIKDYWKVYVEETLPQYLEGLKNDESKATK